MKRCICKSQSQDIVAQLSKNLYFENYFSGPTTVGSIVDSGYERMSNTLSVNSASNISKMALIMEYCICKIQLQNSVFQPSEGTNLEIFSQGPTMVGLIVDTQYERTSNTLNVFDSHAPIAIGDNRPPFEPGNFR